jgi:hypothetical protein
MDRSCIELVRLRRRELEDTIEYVVWRVTCYHHDLSTQSYSENWACSYLGYSEKISAIRIKLSLRLKLLEYIGAALDIVFDEVCSTITYSTSERRIQVSGALYQKPK